MHTPEHISPEYVRRYLLDPYKESRKNGYEWGQIYVHAKNRHGHNIAQMVVKYLQKEEDEEDAA